MPLVGVIMGSSSDEATIAETVSVLDQMGIENEVTVASAHRTPEKVMEYVTGARDRGIEVLIAAAGGSAGLPGVVASWTTLPVIGVPLPSSDLNGVDALYAIAQMPPGHSRRLRRCRLLGRAQRRIPRSADSRHQARQHPRRLRRLSPRPEKPLISSAFSQG